MEYQGVDVLPPAGVAANCQYGECHHVRRRERAACQRKLRHARLRELDHKEGLIRLERVRLMLDAERDPEPSMPSYDLGSDNCEACLALETPAFSD